MNYWLKRCVFNLDLNRESVSEPRTLSGRLFQSLGAKYENVCVCVCVRVTRFCENPAKVIFCDLLFSTKHHTSYDL